MSQWTGGGVVPCKPPPQLRKGSIVKAPVIPDGGVTKPRPAVIVRLPTRDEPKYWVIGITSDNGRYDPSDAVRYPHDRYFEIPGGTTKFDEPSAAKADWVQRFAREQLIPTSAYVSESFADELWQKAIEYHSRSARR